MKVTRHIDPSVIRTRTCKYLIALLVKAKDLLLTHHKQSTVKLIEEIDHLVVLKEKQSRKYPLREERDLKAQQIN